MIRRVSSFLRLPPLLAVALSVLLPFEASYAQGTSGAAPVQSSSFDPSDVYFQGYLATRDAEKLEADGDLVGADEKYVRAKKMFDSIRMYYPDWKPDMVKGRQEKTGETIGKIRPKADAIRLAKQKSLAELEGGAVASGRVLPPAHDAQPLPDSNPAGPLNSKSQPAAPIQPAKPLETVRDNRLNRAEADVARLQQQLDQARRDLDVDAQSRLSRSESQKRDLQAQRDFMQAQLNKAQTDLAGLRARLATAPVESEIGGLNEKIEKLEMEREAMGRALTQSRNQIANAEASNRTLKADMEVLKTNLAKLSQAKVDADANLALQTKITAEVVAGQQTQIKELQNTLKQKDTQLAAAESKIQLLGQELQKSQDAFAQLQTERDSLLLEKEQMSNLLKLNEAGRIQQLIEQNMGLAKDLREAKERVDRLSADNNVNQDLYNDALRDFAIAKYQINNLQAEKREQDKRISELELRLKSEESSLAAGGADPAEMAVLRDIIKKQLTVQERRRQAREELVEAVKQLGSQDETLARAIAFFDGQEVPLSVDELKLVSGAKVTDNVVYQPNAQSREAADETTAINRDVAGYDMAAKRAFMSNRFESARELYEMSLDAQPRDLNAVCKLGFIQTRLQDWPAAMDVFRRATELDPSNAYAWRMTGYTQWKLGDLSAGERALRKALDVKPDDAASRLILAKIYFSQGRMGECESECRAAIAADPMISEAYYNLAVICSRSKRSDDAQRYYKQSLERGGLPDYNLEKQIGL